MKILKIKFGLFSLLAVLAVSVFLTSCEQEALIDQHDDFDSTVLSKEVIVDQSQVKDYLGFEKAKKHIKVKNGQLTLAESVKSENFTEKQSKDITSHLDRINKQVLNGQNDVTAEDILSGREYTITYELGKSDDMEKAECTGERSVDVTYTIYVPTGVTLYLNSCDTNRLVTYGCATLGGLISAIDGPSPVVDFVVGVVVGTECAYFFNELVSTNCPYGIIIRASVLYQLEYIICQDPPSCLNYNAWNYHQGTGWIYVYGYPASWVWSDKYQDFIKLYDQTDICDYGIFFETNNPICGKRGRMWDNNVSDSIMWDYSNGGVQFILTCFTGRVAEDIEPTLHQSSEYSLESMPIPPNSLAPDFTPNSNM